MDADIIFVILAVGVVLAIPVIAIVALVRTAGINRRLEEASSEFRTTISGLKGDVVNLRRELAEVTKRVSQAGAVASTPAPARVVAETPVVQPPVREAVKPAPAPVIAAQAAMTIPAPVVRKEETPANDAPKAEPVHASAPALPTMPFPIPAAAAIKQESQPKPIDSPTTVAGTVPASALPNRSVQTPQAPVWAATPYAPPRDPGPPRKTIGERLRAILPLEEVLGMNLFAKIGIVLMVLGFAFLGQLAFRSMGAGAKVALIYAVGAAMLGGGIWLEMRERYQLLGRVGIGGGWALLFFTTYAMYHVAAMTVLSSNTLDCVLMLVVAAAMVSHTLRYKSQLVTGLAFLLAFSTVALSQDSVYALVAGVILALAIVGVALKMGWYELEIFGIVASFANHFYWLYQMYPDGMAGHKFPQFLPSTIILLLYWLVFRVSYVVRKIRGVRDERVSTIAALVNTMLLGAVMKFQSTRPELAFYGLLALGAAEFTFGQLPITRRRRPAFVLLTVLGTLLMFAGVPFKFSGNNIALFWMMGAEALLIAGIAQQEVLFRRLGAIAGMLTGLLVVYEAGSIIDLRMRSEAPLYQDGILLLTCSALFYLNSLFVAKRWKPLFAGMDELLMDSQSYLGGATAFLGTWAIFTSEWTAVAWAALMLCATLGVRRWNNKHLLVQAAALFVAFAVRAGGVNVDFFNAYPHHIAGRLISLPILAVVAYAAAWVLSGVEDLRVALRTALLWTGSALLMTLAWLEMPQAWVALVWIGFAVALALIGRRIKVSEFVYQEHVLAAAVCVQLLAVNLSAHSATERYLPFLACAAALYAISRFSTLPDAPYRRPAAWVHTWAATGLLATLAWSESNQPWLAAIWAVFALALAAVDRVFDVEELPYQAHVLALLAVLRAISLNFYDTDKWQGVDLRLITVSILVAVLYALARWVRLPASLKDPEIRHLYTWVSSALAAWSLWSELQPIAVAPGLTMFGLLLFEVGMWKTQKQLRLQGYVTLAAAFVRIFFVNLTAASLPGEWLSPRILTVAPIALILFYVWSRLQSDKAETELGTFSVGDLIAYLGTASVSSLMYFETPAQWIIVAWAILALALMAATLLLKKEVFQQQAALVVAGIVGRGLAHDIFGGSYFVDSGWAGNVSTLLITSALLLGTLPIAFRLRKRYLDREQLSFLSRYTGVRYPEQIFFFAPVVLITVMIVVKMHPGMITLSWGIEGLLLTLLGLALSQRSYRIAGLLLLLLCVGKIVLLDAWRLDLRDRYITFIALGAALTLVSALYSRFREIVSKLL